MAPESWPIVSRLSFDDLAACEAWDRLVSAHPAHLAFYSTTYGRLLLRLLPAVEPVYFMAHQAGQLCGIMPTCLQSHGPFGGVLNALPYFGSHGAPLVSAPTQASVVRTALLNAFDDLARSAAVASATVISNPLDADTHAALVERYGAPLDTRIGQLTPVPAFSAGDGAVSDLLLATYHGKTRNVVRRALAGPLTVGRDESTEGLRRLAALHKENLTALGGRAKPEQDFLAIAECFAPSTGRSLWVATYDGQPVAYLLCLYMGRVVEYFTPAVAEAFRPLQPLSLLVHHALGDAVLRGAQWWNWGGTWASQDGVYRFKHRWGTEDHHYGYFTTVYNGALRAASRHELLDAYPGLYVIPFRELTA